MPSGDGGEQPGLPPGSGSGAGSAHGAGRAGRRSNGLSAPAYAVLARFEPQVADALLGTLAGEGIAAYAMPYEEPVGATVWVDTAALQAARDILAARYPTPAQPPAPAEDAAWQEIVASLRRPRPDGPAPWPAAENLEPAAASISGSAGPPTIDASEEEHFVPPPPPPVPVPTGAPAFGLAALIGGFAVLLVPTLAGDPVSPALLVLAIVAIVGGFVTLVAGMRPGPPTDSDPDDGAVL